jgi:hypothetical protein
VTAADRDRATRDRLGDPLIEGVGSQMPTGWVWNLDKALDALLPVVAELVREGQAEAVREFSVEAADRALVLGRRGPSSVADWLLDLGSDAIAALRAPRIEGADG